MKKTILLSGIIVFISVSASLFYTYYTKTSHTTLSVTQTCALTGPAEALGKGINEGLSAALDGNNIALNVIDDGYDDHRVRCFIDLY